MRKPLHSVERKVPNGIPTNSIHRNLIKLNGMSVYKSIYQNETPRKACHLQETEIGKVYTALNLQKLMNPIFHVPRGETISITWLA